MTGPTDDDLRKLWREAGGAFHGPKVETGYMTEARLLDLLRGLLGETTLAEAQAAGAMSLLDDVRNDCLDARQLARSLSDALLSIRPLGGSELFMKVGDEFYADPDICKAEIERLRADLHRARRNEVRAIRLLARNNSPQAPAAQGTVAGWKLVPVEPTDEMLAPLHEAVRAFIERESDTINFELVWSDILSASPSPEALPASGVEAMREALKEIAEHTNPDDADNYRADDREGCFDTVYAIAIAALAPATEGSFQGRVGAACAVAFEGDPTDVPERCNRFAEEALEVAQAFGMTREEMHALVDYTFGRPPGEPANEIGAAMATLASLCVYSGHDLMACAEADLAKFKRPETVARIRAKRATRHGRGPLPGLDPKIEELRADLSPEVSVMPLAFGKSREWFERKAREEPDADPTTGVPTPGEDLCDDEGCPHYGTPHVCISSRTVPNRVVGYAYEESGAPDDRFGDPDAPVVWREHLNKNRPAHGPGIRNVRPVYAGKPLAEDAS